ncbi:MAG: hypothetical protein QOH88_728 [Verrucomicrobiota bacterium]|jgi:hypothetical protein
MLFEKLARKGREEPLLITAVVLAVLVRFVFWKYTGRIWEDALITLTPARNAWLGNGLTHHLSEPRVHSFTSPLSVLIPLAGEGFGRGLLFLRLSALAGAVCAVVFAHRIAQWLKVHWTIEIFLLAYLAFDQLQIFFGMSGMETQVATAILLATVFYLLTRQWNKLGIWCGLAMLARPENLLWLAIVGSSILVMERGAIWRWVVRVTAVFGPWVLFTIVYYGSPIPHTIVAKSFYGGGILRWLSWPQLWLSLSGLWTSVAPFAQYFFTFRTPFPDFFLQLVSFLYLVFFLCGLWVALRAKSPLIGVGLFVILFLAYRIQAQIPTYFMWYLPPITALGAILVMLGLQQVWLALPKAAAALSFYLALAYAVHIPFTFPLERRIQSKVEMGVRWKVGRYLDGVMTSNDAVVLETLGYIGFAAFNKTTYDYPGLSSKVVTDTFQSLPPGKRYMNGLLETLRPKYAALRDMELESFQRNCPVAFRDYSVAAVISAAPGLDLKNAGVEFVSIDTKFTVLRRNDPPAKRP